MQHLAIRQSHLVSAVWMGSLAMKKELQAHPNVFLRQ